MSLQRIFVYILRVVCKQCFGHLKATRASPCLAPRRAAWLSPFIIEAPIKYKKLKTFNCIYKYPKYQ